MRFVLFNDSLQVQPSEFVPPLKLFAMSLLLKPFEKTPVSSSRTWLRPKAAKCNDKYKNRVNCRKLLIGSLFAWNKVLGV